MPPFALLTPLTKHTRYETALRRAMIHKNAGVRVHWGPPGSGKTTYSKHVARQLQDEGYGVIAVRCSPTAECHPMTWFRRALGIADDTRDDLAELLQHSLKSLKRPIFLLDQAEKIFVAAGPSAADVEKFIVSLAEESQQTQTFSVYLNITDATLARHILTFNGREKILASMDPSLQRWGRDETAEFFKCVGWSDLAVQKATELATTAGTPGFALSLSSLDEQSFMADLDEHTKTAKVKAQAWELGSYAVSTSSLFP